MDLPVIEWLRRNPFSEAQPPSPRDNPPCISVNGKDVPVIIRRNARATRLTLRLAADGSEVRMTIPRWGRPSEALAFAQEKRGWIAEKLAQIPQPNPPQQSGTVTIQGIVVPVAWNAKNPRTPKLADGHLHVGGPQETLQPRLQRWLEARALTFFTADLVDYCARARVPVPALRLSRAKRRWGSCATDGCIRINWRLIQAPDHVRRSVIAHEVAHLTHFDHSPAFYAHLSAIFDADLPAADHWLKQHGRSLYTAFG